MKKTFAAAMAAFAMTAAVTPASAANILPAINLDPLSCTANQRFCTASFSVQGVAAGDFTQAITFTLPFDGKFNGSLTTDAAHPLLDIDFSSVSIGSQGYTKDVGDPNERWSLVNYIIGNGQHQINLLGTSAGLGSFSGTISFAAIPEPTTWALMILGFGVIGAALRRRQTANVSLRYA